MNATQPKPLVIVPLIATESDVTTRSTGWGDTRVSLSVYYIQARDGLGHNAATQRSEAIAYYTDDRTELPAAVARFLSYANNCSAHEPL